jgi:aspartyl protease family protein
MSRLLQRSALLLLLVFSSASAQDLPTVYRCVDKLGRVLYTDDKGDGCKLVSLLVPEVKLDSIRIKRSRDGHFSVYGTVENVRVKFLIDTGASAVSVSSEAAEAGNLPSGKPIVVETAAGMRSGRKIEGVAISIGGLAPIQTTVTSGLRGGSPEDALLGQSFLRHFDMRVIGDEMTLVRRK